MENLKDLEKLKKELEEKYNGQNITVRTERKFKIFNMYR